MKRSVPALVAAAALLGSCASGPSSGRVLGLSAFDGASEGGVREDGAPYFSFSIRPVVSGDRMIEILSADVAETDGPVEVIAVLTLPPDHEQRPIPTGEAETEDYVDALRAQQLTTIGDCGQPTCEVAFAIVARRTDSSESGVVRKLEVRYRVDGREYIESTTFAVGLCVPTEDVCT